MKKVLIPFIIICFIAASLEAQVRDRPGRNMRPLKRIEQLEKMKLIEVLELNEETAIKFFARRQESQKKMKEILDHREEIISNIENAIKNNSQTNDAFYKEHVNKLLAIEGDITKERETFLRSLNDLLTPQQIARLVVFESKFRKEVRETLMGRGPGPMKD